MRNKVLFGILCGIIGVFSYIGVRTIISEVKFKTFMAKHRYSKLCSKSPFSCF